MEKINVAELLKDCPKGMELYSPIYGNGILTKVTDRIHVKFPKEHNVKCFRPDGRVSEDGEIMIFPKGKTTWEGFVSPSKFKDGDIVATDSGRWLGIIKNKYNSGYYTVHCAIDYTFNDIFYRCGEYRFSRLATEEEKARLFQAIKEHGYRWNPETKTLENLIEPKFKVGDKIKLKENHNYIYTVTGIREKENKYECGVTFVLRFSEQDDWELVPNKFDINTLVPFESRVLVRNVDGDLWKPAIYGFPHSKGCYVVGGVYWRQCIPYEENKELLRTTNNPEEYGSR